MLLKLIFLILSQKILKGINSLHSGEEAIYGNSLKVNELKKVSFCAY